MAAYLITWQECSPFPANTPPMPMIMIESSSGDPAEVTKTLELVLAQADGTLHDIQAQAQVPTNLMVSSFVVAPPSTPSAGMPSRTRSTVAIFIAGAGLTVLMTVLVDILLIRIRVMVTATTAGACRLSGRAGLDSPRTDTNGRTTVLSCPIQSPSPTRLPRRTNIICRTMHVACRRAQ